MIDSPNQVDVTSKLSINRQLSLLEISKGSFYYKPKGEKKENEKIMRIMDSYILEDPTAGVKTMQAMLLDSHQIKAGYERVRRLIRKMGIMAIYPKKHLTVLGNAKYIYPYLLRDLKIKKANQVWQIDITYIPMKKGHMYLTAIIDVYSRMIVGWGLSNSLDAQSSLKVIKQTIAKYGKPEILNSDQGSQFTCKEYISLLKKEKIKISMDGKGRAIDNIYIERFFRSLKYRYVYLNPANDGWELYLGIDKWINEKYNRRRHQGTNEIPIKLYNQAA